MLRNGIVEWMELGSNCAQLGSISGPLKPREMVSPPRHTVLTAPVCSHILTKLTTIGVRSCHFYKCSKSDGSFLV